LNVEKKLQAKMVVQKCRRVIFVDVQNIRHQRPNTISNSEQMTYSAVTLFWHMLYISWVPLLPESGTVVSSEVRNLRSGILRMPAAVYSYEYRQHLRLIQVCYVWNSAIGSLYHGNHSALSSQEQEREREILSKNSFGFLCKMTVIFVRL
jgi:hypothetical protein